MSPLAFAQITWWMWLQWWLPMPVQTTQQPAKFTTEKS
jgi:hypothetical protein